MRLRGASGSAPGRQHFTTGVETQLFAVPATFGLGFGPLSLEIAKDGPILRAHLIQFAGDISPGESQAEREIQKGWTSFGRSELEKFFGHSDLPLLAANKSFISKVGFRNESAR